MKVSIIYAASFFAILPSLTASAANTMDIYCMQVKPETHIGFILESATLSQEGEPTVRIGAFGLGIRDAQGDGTISETEFELRATNLQPSWENAAKSPQWKNTVPFLLEEKSGRQYVLYIEKAAFEGASEFKARIKYEENGKEKNFTLTCNRQ